MMHAAMISLPMVSIVIPCRNEHRQIEGCLDSILAGDYPPDRLEVVVADGMSNDGTREILQRYSQKHGNVRLIDNPGKAVSSGLNLAIQAARGEIIIRMDAHTEYAADYVRQCVEVLQETGADNVGGAARTKADSFIQKAVSIAYHSPFAVGGARFHNVDHEGFVDTVPYGCWKKTTLMELGLFDEELIRNQDDELNLRLIRRGGRIWQSRRIRSWYHPRSSLSSLFRQYSQYGYWKVRVIQKHRLPASWRHLVPGTAVAGAIVLGGLSPFLAGARWLLAASVLMYGSVSLAATLLACREPARFRFIPILPAVFAIYHFSYGYGFLRGCLDFTLLRRGARESFEQITREVSPKLDK